MQNFGGQIRSILGEVQVAKKLYLNIIVIGIDLIQHKRVQK